MPLLAKTGDGIWWSIAVQAVGTVPFFLTPFGPCKVTPEDWYGSLGMDITLDDVFTLLDEHYNNVNALDVLNQALFQLRMTGKETVSDWGVSLSRHLQVLAASFPDHFPLYCMVELKCDCFYGRLPKWLKAMVAYLKASPQEKTYSNYLWAAREAEKEDSLEPSQGHTANSMAKPR